ncbi:MAG: BON domain-containing protein [Thermoguttaceae bacterium]|jgi:osmotically-inducible protein OsmY
MLRKDPVPDGVLTQKVSQSLSNRGVRAPCRVAVATQKGTVTLSGKIQYEHQRQVAIQTARNVEGVTRIVDQLQVIIRAAPPKNQNQW